MLVNYSPTPAFPGTKYAISYSLTRVFMLSATDGWAAGSAQEIIPGSDTGAADIILHYTQGAWQELSSPSIDAGGLLDLFMVSPTEGWATGNSFLHYLNGVWTPVNVPGNSASEFVNPQYIDMLSATNGWATAQQSSGGGPIITIFLRYQHGAWQVFTNE